jgi:hypothetical protein
MVVKELQIKLHRIKIRNGLYYLYIKYVLLTPLMFYLYA